MKVRFSTRQLIIVVHDVLMTALALFVSFFLRWGSTAFWERIENIALVFLGTVPLALVAYWLFGLTRTPWRFVSTFDVGRIMAAAAVPAVALVVVGFLSRDEYVVVPRTVPMIYWLVQVALLVGPRVLYRAYRARRRDKRAFAGTYRAPVLIAGTGDEADALIRRLSQDAVTSLEPVALLTTKPSYVGASIQRVPILGEVGELEAVLERLETRGVKPRRVILTGDVLRHASIDDLLGQARRLGVSPVRVSQAMTRMDADAGPVKLAPVSIDDLLGRPARELDLASVRALVSGRRVLVTGAGGSIGLELCRQIADMGPDRMMVLDHSELALWTVGKVLRVAHPDLPVEPHLGSVRDGDDLGAAFRRFRPEIVFHAAALKHVDIVETHPVAAAGTNTIGTVEVARLAAETGARCAVFISTDKAVDPVSILGATKRAGELVFAEADRTARDRGAPTRFLTVRFGNVLGSSGSVIPLFAEQLAGGGPITVTHPEVERYFMTISEAVTLVLMASAEGIGSDDVSPVYVLDMGEPVRIVDLANRMIRLAGLEPDVDVPIRFTGLRPGERLREALESDGEMLRPTGVPGVRVTNNPRVNTATFGVDVDRLRSAVAASDEDGVRQTLAAIVPVFGRTVTEGIAAPSPRLRVAVS